MNHTGPYISTQSGEWFNSATWGGFGVPDFGSSVTISQGHTVHFEGTVRGVQSLTNHGTLLQEGSMGFKNGALENDGNLIAFAGADFWFEGACNICNTASWSGMSLDFTFHNDEVPSTSTLEGFLYTYSVLAHNSNLNITPDSLYTNNLTLSGNTTVKGDVKYGPGNGIVFYKFGNFTVGDEWKSEDHYTGSDAPDGVFLWYGSATLNVLPPAGKSYLIDNISVSNGCYIGGEGTVKVITLLENSGHLQIAGTLRDGSGTGLANVSTSFGGSITTTKTLAATGPVTFEYTGAAMDFASLGNVNQVGVTAHIGAVPNAPASIANGNAYFELFADGTGFNTTLKLPHANYADPYVCRYSGVGDSWVPGRSSFDSTTVQLDNVTAFSTWAVGNAVLGPLPVSVSLLEVE